MKKERAQYPSGAELPASKVAERLRAHARLCRQVANESWNERIAVELTLLADQCVEAADNIEGEAPPAHLLH